MGDGTKRNPISEVVLLALTLTFLWQTVAGRGVDLGLCSNENVVCNCGNVGGVQIHIPIKRCTFFYKWKPYCKACEKYDQNALCSQFRHCLTCNADRNGGCLACPFGYYGKHCQGVCQCQNGGICNPKDGSCKCPAGYEGARCGKSRHSTCGQAPTLRHGTVSGNVGGNVQSGSVVTYRCDNGYTLVGPTQKRCEKNGRWTGGEPRCEYMCAVPESRPFLDVSVEPYVTMPTKDNPQGVELVRRLRFSCKGGYVLRGRSELNCLSTNQWNGEVPTCVPKAISMCDSLVFQGRKSPNKPSYSVGSRVTLSCDSGFRLEGMSTLTCLDNGRWDDAVPKCVPGAKKCPMLTVPENGSLNPSNTLGSVTVGQKVQLKCNAGYVLEGSAERQCQRDGTWSGTLTKCTKGITCDDPETSKNVERAKVEIPSALGRGNRLGRGRNRFSKVVRTQTRGPFRVGTKITFKCKTDGYTLEGSSVRVCQGNGQWSGQQPSCIPVCGISVGARLGKIIRGVATKVGDYPWQAMLSHRRESGEFYGVCGGSMISEDWIMTAAHCVTEQGTRNLLPVSIIKIQLGKYYRDNNKDDSSVQEFTISEIHVNPNFNPQNLDSDMALLKLSKSAILSKRVMPICLPKTSLDQELLSPDSSFVSVTGWGETENRTDSDLMLATRLAVISNKACEDRYRETQFPLEVTKNMFCAGHDDARTDTCFGDSGGPAVAYKGSGLQRRWYIVGVVSWGSPIDCAVPMHYSGFTRVSQFLNYISSILNR